MSPEQVKVLNRLLDGGERRFEGGISAALYQKVAKVSKATAIWQICYKKAASRSCRVEAAALVTRLNGNRCYICLAPDKICANL